MAFLVLLLFSSKRSKGVVEVGAGFGGQSGEAEEPDSFAGEDFFIVRVEIFDKFADGVSEFFWGDFVDRAFIFLFFGDAELLISPRKLTGGPQNFFFVAEGSFEIIGDILSDSFEDFGGDAWEAPCFSDPFFEDVFKDGSFLLDNFEDLSAADILTFRGVENSGEEVFSADPAFIFGTVDRIGCA